MTEKLRYNTLKIALYSIEYLLLSKLKISNMATYSLGVLQSHCFRNKYMICTGGTTI